MCRILVVFALFFISPILYAEPVAWDGPGKQGWLTASSTHFQVHYPVGETYEAAAQRTLYIAEKAHQDFLPFFGVEPVRKTQMVISDDNDFSNGWATFFPFAQIRLYLTPPYRLSGLENYDDWLSLVIRHEYVHVLHLEMAKGLPKYGRKVLGRFPGAFPFPGFFPHSLTSPMLIEGLAVYLETDYEKGTGRLASSWYQMLMQEEVESENFSDLGQAVITSNDWPYGQHYLYGAFFIEYLAQTYGEESIQAWLKEYSGEIIPWYNQNNIARRIFGKSFNELWGDFAAAMKHRFSKPKPSAHIEDRFVAANSAVRLQKISSNGDVVVYLARNDEDRPVLKLCEDHNSCSDLVIDGAQDISDLDINSSGEVVAVRQIQKASGRLQGDVFLLQEGKWVPLTQDLRAASVRWLPNEQATIISSIDAGNSRLTRVDLDGTQEILWQGSYGDVIGEFDVHPNGQLLVVSKKSLDQPWDLEVFDLTSKNWLKLTQNQATESSPEFTQGGRLLYVSDEKGRFNIYVYGENPVALSHVSTGAFAPVVLNNYLVYQAYTAEGFEFRSTGLESDEPDFDFEYWVQKKNSLDLSAVSQEYVTQDGSLFGSELGNGIETTLGATYEPWTSLRPYYWLPYWRFDNESSLIGFATSGNDALERHSYYLGIDYDLEDELLGGTISYRYERWLAALSVDYTKYLLISETPDKTILKEEQALLQRNWLYRAFEDHLGIHSGLVHRRLSLEQVESGVDVVGSRQVSETSIGIATTLNYRGYLTQSPGIGYGSYSHFVLEDFSLMSSDAQGVHFQAGWDYTFDLPGRQGLTLAVAAGYADDDAPGWEIGGLPPQEDGQLFGRDELSLRGYNSGAQSGQYYERERLTYRRQLWLFNNNWGIWPIGIGELGMKTYIDRGRAWSDRQTNQALIGLGLEARVNLILAYRLHVPLVVGVAKGLDGTLGEEQAYIEFRFAVP